MEGSHADGGEPCGRRGVMERMEREKPDDVASAGFRNAIDFAWSHTAGKFKQLKQMVSFASAAVGMNN